MKKLKLFLKLVEKLGYPSPEVSKLMDYMEYSPHHYLMDLQVELGNYETRLFILKTFSKLKNYKDFIKIYIPSAPEGSWVALKIRDIEIKKNDSEFIELDWEIPESYITDPETGEGKTIAQIQDDADMGEWADVSDFIDNLLLDCVDYILENTGFRVYFE